MKKKSADIIATVNLFPSNAGGRRGPTPDGKFHCMITMDQQNFDVRLDLEDIGSISPGQTVKVPICFLDPEHAKKHWAIGKAFTLREGKIIGDGIIHSFSRSGPY
jgi:hypothetical protein